MEQPVTNDNVESVDTSSSKLEDSQAGNLPTGQYAAPHTGVDWHHLQHLMAKLVIILAYGWYCFYFILEYRPERGTESIAGQYEAPFQDHLSTLKNLWCPRDTRDSCIFTTNWIYPAFLGLTFITFFTRKQAIQPHQAGGKFALHGDMDFVLWSWIGLAMPLCIYFCYYMYYKWYTNEEEWNLSVEDGGWTDGEKLDKAAGTWANRFGDVAMIALSFFMIPASRHGPVLNLMGWHPYHACTIHMFAGWVSFWGSWLHFICYIIRYASSKYPTARNPICIETQGGWPGYRWIFPPAMCFTYNKVPNYEWFNPETNTTDLIDPPCFRDCGKQINGFYGTIAILAFTILALTSMQVVRRYKYTVFYFSHIICAPIFIIFVVMHWKFIYYYLVPSACYYFATQAPFLVQYSRKTVDNYGLKIVNVMDIPCRQSPKPTVKLTESKTEQWKREEEAHKAKRSLLARIFSPDSIDWLDEQLNRRGPQDKSIEHCVSFDFIVSETGFEQFYPGMYGNIWCPDASMKSHPFSVTHVPGRTDQLRIIFRVFGKWTDLLARSLIQLPSERGFQQSDLPIPKIMMDGWHGPDHLVGSALNHDKVTIVTAGIGITAFLSMFTELIEVLCFRKDGLFVTMDEIEGEPITTQFELHWSCRDENLIKYITDEYFQPLIEESERYGGVMTGTADYQGVRCLIHIHRTGEAGAKTLNPTSLWKSFRDPTERGLMELDFGLMGTFGTAWVPYRFSFGRYESFYKHIPSVIVFTTCLWCGWAGAQQMGFWLWPNVFGFPEVLRNFVRGLFYLPIVAFSFAIAWLAHVIMDWTRNVEASVNAKQKARRTSKQNKGTMKTVDDDEILGASWNGGRGNMGPSSMSQSMIGGGQIGPDGDFLEEDTPDGVLFENKMISLESTSGRPNLDTVLQGEGVDDFASTGLYMCGPAQLIRGCKEAAGTTVCRTGERVQNLIKGNKFVFYEEKFEW
eukprot:CAMPEP_0170793606 /NCGR_PEP_ID=MMETSP0733-20121128/22796_1 /TAXON_ID=186038 /ORGANISM="Fragilariopsis kerguelensis, Strain L26-C5" /LENGTH=965 /DNA_ID=CAMNT_0011142671 /DNA_START=114 /DNA_END=3008 /DNA_ORIENTATION=-